LSPFEIPENGFWKDFLFIVFTSDHARIYDISIRRAASMIYPVRPTSRSNSAFPGPDGDIVAKQQPELQNHLDRSIQNL